MNCKKCGIEVPKPKCGIRKYCTPCAKLVKEKQVKIWQHTHRDNMHIIQNRWKKNNPEKYKECNRVNVHAWCEKNPTYHNEYQRILRSNRKSGLVDEIWESQNKKCKNCGKKVTGRDKCQDHIMPLSKGGSNERENIQVLCRKCNSRKKDKIDS